jgi:hypothetical protein
MRLIAPRIGIVKVPTINDDKTDFIKLFQLWEKVCNCKGCSVTFDFSECRFLRPNAVAFLGGLARLLEFGSGKPIFDWNTLQGNVKANLAQNGFMQKFEGSIESWKGNSVPYREDRNENQDGFVRYLEETWLGRDWIQMNASLKDVIVGRMYEIYANAFEHSSSPVGTFTCGQNFPNRSELKLTIIDFGVGIPANVRSCTESTKPASECLKWAFQEGNTTRKSQNSRVPGGQGLDWLKEFVKMNRGTLEIFSHDAYALVDETNETYNTFDAFFEGTLVNITLQCDEAYYHLNL